MKFYWRGKRGEVRWARAAGYAWSTVPEAARAGGYTHLRDHEEFINLSLYGTCGFYAFNNDDSRVHYTFIIGLANLWMLLNPARITLLQMRTFSRNWFTNPKWYYSWVSGKIRSFLVIRSWVIVISHCQKNNRFVLLFRKFFIR